MLSEFDLIAKYFTKPVRNASLGIGDDCALLTPVPGMQIAISTDMLVSGTHFFPDTDPRQLGHKSLAVNLSDLAAMGAEPLAFTLALSLRYSDEFQSGTHFVVTARNTGMIYGFPARSATHGWHSPIAVMKSHWTEKISAPFRPVCIRRFHASH